MSVLQRIASDFRGMGGDVSATCTLPDPETGDKVRIVPVAFPVGDIRDPQTWLDAAEAGCDITGKTDAGTGKVNVKLRSVSGDNGRTYAAALFGLASVGKPTRKRSGKPDTVDSRTGEPSTNGAAS